MVHRAPDSRLLTNLLQQEKEYQKHLNSLLDHSHSSLASFSAYAAASSPPASHVILTVTGFLATADDALRRYAGAVDQCREHLRALKVLEDDIGNILRDREILVTRLLKASKSHKPARPAMYTAGAAGGAQWPSSASSLSLSHFSHASLALATSSKLSAAQAELQACETHLATKERELAARRVAAFRDGMALRCTALVETGWVWAEMGKEALSTLSALSTADCPRAPEQPRSRPISELSSVAPSQSASQTNAPSTSFLTAPETPSPRLEIPIPPAHAISNAASAYITVPFATVPVAASTPPRHVLSRRITEEDLSKRMSLSIPEPLSSDLNKDLPPTNPPGVNTINIPNKGAEAQQQQQQVQQQEQGKEAAEEEDDDQAGGSSVDDPQPEIVGIIDNPRYITANTNDNDKDKPSLNKSIPPPLSVTAPPLQHGREADTPSPATPVTPTPLPNPHPESIPITTMNPPPSAPAAAPTQPKTSFIVPFAPPKSQSPLSSGISSSTSSPSRSKSKKKSRGRSPLGPGAGAGEGKRHRRGSTSGFFGSLKGMIFKGPLESENAVEKEKEKEKDKEREREKEGGGKRHALAGLFHVGKHDQQHQQRRGGGGGAQWETRTERNLRELRDDQSDGDDGDDRTTRPREVGDGTEVVQVGRGLHGVVLVTPPPPLFVGGVDPKKGLLIGKKGQEQQQHHQQRRRAASDAGEQRESPSSRKLKKKPQGQQLGQQQQQPQERVMTAKRVMGRTRSRSLLDVPLIEAGLVLPPPLIADKSRHGHHGRHGGGEEGTEMKDQKQKKKSSSSSQNQNGGLQAIGNVGVHHFKTNQNGVGPGLGLGLGLGLGGLGTGMGTTNGAGTASPTGSARRLVGPPVLNVPPPPVGPPPLPPDSGGGGGGEEGKRSRSSSASRKRTGGGGGGGGGEVVPPVPSLVLVPGPVLVPYVSAGGVKEKEKEKEKKEKEKLRKKRMSVGNVASPGGGGGGASMGFGALVNGRGRSGGGEGVEKKMHRRSASVPVGAGGMVLFGGKEKEKEKHRKLYPDPGAVSLLSVVEGGGGGGGKGRIVSGGVRANQVQVGSVDVGRDGEERRGRPASREGKNVNVNVNMNVKGRGGGGEMVQKQKQPLRSALKRTQTPSSSPSPVRGEAVRRPMFRRKGSGVPERKASGVEEEGEDDDEDDDDEGREGYAESVSSYETGQEVFVDAPEEAVKVKGAEMFVPPKGNEREYENENERRRDVGYVGAAEDGDVVKKEKEKEKRRKSVRVSLKPTFSPDPLPVVYGGESSEDGDGEENGWVGVVRPNGKGKEKGKEARKWEDVWVDSSEEDEEYSRAKRMLGKVASANVDGVPVGSGKNLKGRK